MIKEGAGGWTQTPLSFQEELPCLGGMVMDLRGAQGDPGTARGTPTGLIMARISGNSVLQPRGLCPQG